MSIRGVLIDWYILSYNNDIGRIIFFFTFNMVSFPKQAKRFSLIWKPSPASNMNNVSDYNEHCLIMQLCSYKRCLGMSFLICTNSQICGVQSFRDTIAIGIGIDADAAGIGIPVSGISVWFRRIPVPEWGTLIPVPDSTSFRHLRKLHKCTSTEGRSVRLYSSHGAALLSREQRSSVGYSVAQ